MTETIGKKKKKKDIFSFSNIYFCIFFLFGKDFSQLPDNIKEYISILQHDNNRYTTELESLRTQLNNLTAVVDFADSTRIAEIADLKQRHQQELETINILMEGNLNVLKKIIFLWVFLFRNNS
jgi:hypothetical protein